MLQSPKYLIMLDYKPLDTDTRISFLQTRPRLDDDVRVLQQFPRFKLHGFDNGS